MKFGQFSSVQKVPNVKWCLHYSENKWVVFHIFTGNIKQNKKFEYLQCRVKILSHLILTVTKTSYVTENPAY